jgi:hypothetical protein
LSTAFKRKRADEREDIQPIQATICPFPPTEKPVLFASFEVWGN